MFVQKWADEVTVCCAALLQVFKNGMLLMVLLHKPEGLEDFVVALDKVRASLMVGVFSY